MIVPKSNDELLKELTVGLVAAYVGNNALRPTDIPELIENVHAALANLDMTKEEAKTGSIRLEPAVNPKKSITPDYIICLEDGKKFKSIRRHLMNKFGLTPQQYRQKWDLDPDYPMVAPNYSVLRSQLAKQVGLGRKSMRTRT